MVGGLSHNSTVRVLLQSENVLWSFHIGEAQKTAVLICYILQLMKFSCKNFSRSEVGQKVSKRRGLHSQNVQFFPRISSN